MKPAAFAYSRPTSVEEALDLLAAAGGDAKLIAGGQSLGPMMNMRLATPAQLVDLNDLSELAYVRETDQGLEVGALTRHHQVAESALVQQRCPLLAQAARTIGHYAIRQRGTLGGSLAHADPAAQYALCAVTLGARLRLRRAGATRTVAAADFLRSAMTTDLQPDEMIEAVLFPRFAPREASAFRLFNRRHGDYAIVACAVTLRLEGERVAALRLGVSGAAPVPQLLQATAQAFCGRVPDPAWIDALAAAAREAIAPPEDPRVPALYRRELTEALVARALRRVLERLQGATP